MILELIATVSAGFALFGIAALARALSRNRLPRWLGPAAFAAGMIAYQVWADYSWAGRQMAAYPQLVVAAEGRETSPMRPFSYLVAPVSSIRALDVSRTRIHPEQPDLVLTRLVGLARYAPPTGAVAVFDCAGHRMAPVVTGVELRPDGTLEGADWVGLPETDPVLRRACALREDIADDR